MKVSHHIFASREGYQTQFRSPDVTDSENAELESFSFGQTNDANYMASLKKHPAFTVRKLRSGRWAITRVFQGVDDDYGRATLRFHTVLVSQKEWASCLDFDILPFLEHPTIWKDTESTEISLEPDNSPLPQDISEQVLFLLNQLTGSRSPVIVDESICSLQTIRWVHRRLLDEDKEEFSYGYRVLSDAMDASLLCLASQALRTATSGMRDYNKSHVSAASHIKAPKYEKMDLPYDQPAGSNKMAILIIIMVCVLGIAGAISALVLFSNAQKEKTISGIIKRADLLLDKSYSFIADPNGLVHAVGEADIIIKEIQDLKFKAPELGPISKNLKIWRDEETLSKELFDKFQKLEDRLAKEKLKDVSPPYPNTNKFKDVKKIEDEFKEVLEELLNEFSSLEFFKNEDNNALIEGVQRSRNKIDDWEDNIKKLIKADPNAVDEIESILTETDPNRYTLADPNQIDFSDPNLPYYVDRNTPDWRNPKWFPDLAEQNIATLNKANLRIAKSLNDRSLLKAKISPIPEHNKWANDYVDELTSLKSLVDKNIKAMRTLKREAEGIKRVEDDLIRNRNFSVALKKYEDKIGTKSNAEKVWVNHLKSVIIDFYKDSIEPNLQTYLKSNLNKLYKEIKASSLDSEVFHSLYKRHDELEEPEKQKKRSQKTVQDQNGSNR